MQNDIESKGLPDMGFATISFIMVIAAITMRYKR